MPNDKTSFPSRRAARQLSPALALLAALAAEAQVMVDIESCVVQADPVARFGCYEALARQATGREPGTIAPLSAREVEPPAPPQSAAAAPGALAETAPSAGIEEFGRDERGAGARLETGRDGESALLDTVVKVESLRPNQLTLTLASGQVWRQMLPGRFPLRAGDAVRIYPTRWGKSYRLSSAAAPGFIQVERIDSGG